MAESAAFLENDQIEALAAYYSLLEAEKINAVTD